MRPWIGSITTYFAYALFAGGVLNFALSSRTETQRLRQEVWRIHRDIAKLQKHNQDDARILQALASDPFYVERLLRERYGYRRADEQEPAGLTRIARQAPTQGGRDTPRPRTRRSTDSAGSDTSVSLRSSRRSAIP